MRLPSARETAFAHHAQGNRVNVAETGFSRRVMTGRARAGPVIHDFAWIGVKVVGGRAKPGHDTGANFGRDTGAKAGHDTGAKPGRDTGAKPGHDTGAKAGHDTGAKPGHDTGAKPGHDTGAKPGHDTGAKPGRDTGAKAGRDTGAKPGRDTGAKAGRDTGAKPGHDTGAKAFTRLPCHHAEARHRRSQAQNQYFASLTLTRQRPVGAVAGRADNGTIPLILTTRVHSLGPGRRESASAAPSMAERPLNSS
jgi:hypothetical protein